ANYDVVCNRLWCHAASPPSRAVALLAIAGHPGRTYGIDFTGGSLIQVRYDKPVTVAEVRRGLDDLKLGSAVIQQFGDAREYLIRLPESEQKTGELSARIQGALGRAAGAQVGIRRMEFVAPQVRRYLQ